MFANLNPITTIAWNSTSCAYYWKISKIAGKVPKLQEKLLDFPYFRQKFDRLFLSPYRLRKKNSKKKEQSATVPKDVYCYRYCFLETKECMHNEVGTCAEILPTGLLGNI